MPSGLSLRKGDLKMKATDETTGGNGPKYLLNLEGREIPWEEATITTEKLAELGGWDLAQGVIEIDKNNNERTLKPGETVELKPGHGFAKKVRFKRGGVFEDRVAVEIEMLRGVFPAMQYQVAGHWVLIPGYPLSSNWNMTAVDLAFQVSVSHPGTPPYGVYAPSGLRFHGAAPANYSDPAGTQPPFPGRWAVFSWQPDDGQWRPHADPAQGTNLVNWAIGFGQRFRQGA